MSQDMRPHKEVEDMFNQNPETLNTYQGFDPDWALIRAMADGDVRALNEVYARYGPMLMGFLNARLGNRELAEEVVQDVMLAVWDSARTFEARSKVKTWLLVIARNRAINATRRKKLPLIDISQIFNLKSDDTGPMEVVVRHEAQDRVRSAIQQLPDGQREVLVLVFYHQLTGPEVAEVLDISEGTVKSRLHRAKENLKGLLSQEGNF